jgi:hypothetical protein
MKGIVTLAGGRTYATNAYLNCIRLRYMGCKLPIEWWYFPGELNNKWINTILEMDAVNLRELPSCTREINKKDKGGWQAKPFTILHSYFDEVLFLDADCFPLRCPEYLFTQPLYSEYGAVLWKDIWFWPEERKKHIEKYFKITLPNKFQVESGQIMFNKNIKGILEALQTIETLNNNPTTYKMVYGDKDTFLIGLLQCNLPFNFVPRGPTGISGGLCQYDFDGAALFYHLTGSKWQIHGRTFCQDFPNKEHAQTTLAALRAKLV